MLTGPKEEEEEEERCESQKLKFTQQAIWAFCMQHTRLSLT
jgi:hypothetical protein